jgi:hypothetical protein
MARVVAVLGVAVLAGCTPQVQICDPACAPPRTVVFLHGANLWTEGRTAAAVCLGPLCSTVHLRLPGRDGGTCRSEPYAWVRCDVVDQTVVLDYSHGQDPAAYSGVAVTATVTGGGVSAQRLTERMVYHPQGDGECSCPAYSSAVLDVGSPWAPVSGRS